MAEKLVKDSQGLAKDLVNDCISRQAAIDALDKRFDSIPMEQTTEILQLRKDLRELPSAQPETAERTAETAQNVSDEDLISRKAAIDAIRASTSKYTGFMEMEMYTDDDAVEAIEALPSAQPKSYREGYQAGFKDAQPERKRGTWIIKDNPGTGWYRVTCSECGEDVTSTAPCIGFYPNAKVTWDYCPNCGADMREVDE